MTLLKKAKSFHSPRHSKNISEEHIELAAAWLKDEISYTQCVAALGKKNSVGTYIVLARGAKAYFKQLPEFERNVIAGVDFKESLDALDKLKI